MKQLFSRARWLSLILAFVYLLCIRTTLLAQTDTTRFYYYQKQRITLPASSRLVAVAFDPAAGVETRRAIADATGDIENFDARVPAPVGGIEFMPLRAGRDPLAAVARFSGRAGVTFASPVYELGTTQLAETLEFLARFPDTASDAEIARINAANNVTLVRPLPNSDRILILKPNPGNPRTARELANLYVESGVATFAEPNFVVRVPRPAFQPGQAAEFGNVIPTDSNFNLQWGLKNTRQFQGSVANADIDATDAWSVTQGSSGIVIAVIDEGVYAAHPDLNGKVLTGYNSLNDTNDTSPKTNDHHGTAVAGVAAANSNNNTGIAGVCWFCRILPVKVAERDPQGNWTANIASLASGINWAWQNGADVLNNSWTMTNYSDSVLDAILYARTAGRNDKGSTVVFASGNDNASSVAFPASLNSYVIAVGASNWCDQRKTPSNNGCNNNDTSWGSNYGSALDLVAPGQSIYTTCNGNQCTSGAYTYLGGTSLATPFVSGVVGLLYSLNPNLTPDKVQAALQNSAKDIGSPGKDSETGYGRLDAYRALAALYNLRVTVTDDATFVPANGVVSYVISYANTGSTAMGSAQLRVTVPANTTYDSSTPAFTAQGGGVYALNLGTLASNQTGTATFRVNVPANAAGQKLTLNTTISGAFPESNSGDNAASDTSYVVKSEFYLPMLRRGSAP